LKKLPIIGLLIGAVAAIFIKIKGKSSEPEPVAEAAAPEAPAPQDTTPPA
jgi:hypothetical protein